MNQWEEFKIGPGQIADALHVTLNRKGTFLIGSKTYEKFRRPGFVILMFDRVNSMIGLQPSNRHAMHAYPLFTRATNNYRLVNANKFCRHYGIMTDRTIAFDSPKINEHGILVLDLKKTRIIGKPPKVAVK